MYMLIPQDSIGNSLKMTDHNVVGYVSNLSGKNTLQYYLAQTEPLNYNKG